MTFFYNRQKKRDIYKIGTGCKEAGEKNYVGNISGNLQHL
jgi:hypothetical protein